MGYGEGLILKTCFVVKRDRIESLKATFIRGWLDRRYQTKQCCHRRGLVQGLGLNGTVGDGDRPEGGWKLKAEDYYNGEFDPGSG